MMRDAFEAAAAAVSGQVSARVRVAINRDMTVDGELRLTDIPRNLKIRRLFTLVEEATAWPKGQWMSHLIVFGLRPNEEHLLYKRRRGNTLLSIVSTYYMRTKGDGAALSFAAAKDVADRIQRKGRLKPSEIATRLHWNEKDEKPRRRY